MAKVAGLGIPPIKMSEIPKDWKEFDACAVDQILQAAGLGHLSEKKYGWPTLAWTPIGEKNGVKMFEAKTPGLSLHARKGVAVIPMSVAVFESMTHDSAFMTKVDELCKSCKMFKKFDETHEVEYGQFKAGFACSDREFYFLALGVNLKSGVRVMFSKSIDVPDQPVAPKHCRGEIVTTGYVVEPNGADSCTLTYIVQIDPKGTIPASVVNAATKSQAYIPGVWKEKAAGFKLSYNAQKKK